MTWNRERVGVDQDSDRCWGAQIAIELAQAVLRAGRTSDGGGLLWLKHGGGGEVTRCWQRNGRLPIAGLDDYSL